MESPRITVTRWFALLLVGVAWAAPALPVAGALFLADGGDTGRIPAQRALIQFAEGRQRLVVETALEGSATNFAWVLPLPAVPVIEEVSHGLFPTLSHIFQPRIIVEVRPWWLVLALLGSIGGLVWMLHVRFQLWAAVAGGGALVVAVLATAWLAGLFARAPGIDVGQPNDTVRRLSHQPAVVYEVAVLEAPADYALLGWLALNGFDTPTNTLGVLAEYAREGWIFVAVKARSGAGADGTTVLPPLSFSFATPYPVYPLRLTGVGHGPCQLDLYVFGPGRASASGLHTRRCSRPRETRSRASPRPAMDSGPLRLRHPELRNLANGARFASWLRGSLPPERMQQDLRIHWTDRERRGEKLHTRAAAFQLAANVVAFCLAGCGLIIAGLRYRLPKGHTLHATVSRLLFAVTGIGLLTYWMIPKLEDDRLSVRRVSWSLATEQTERVAQALQASLTDQTSLPSTAPLDSHTRATFLRQAFDREIGHGPGADQLLNLYSGETIRLEASPGNLTLAPNDRGWILSWHDFDGAAALPGALIKLPKPVEGLSESDP
jgi:hypothetical protein